MFDIKKTALVTHKNCIDGSTCAIVFQAAGGLKKNTFFTPPNYVNTDEIVSNLLSTWSGPILMADMSVSYDLAKTINRPDVLLLDHHASAVPLDEFEWAEIEVENNRAGGRMLYDWLVSHNYHVGENNKLINYKDLVLVADDHDRWIKNYPESNYLSLLHNVLGQNLFIKRFLKDHSIELTTSENYLLEIESQKRDEFIQGKKLAVIKRSISVGEDVVNVGFVMANNHQSKLGHAIYEDPEMDIDVVVMIGDGTISMRAKSDCVVDLSVVAKSHGGGGHKEAAGLSLSNLLEKDLIELVIEKLKFE